MGLQKCTLQKGYFETTLVEVFYSGRCFADMFGIIGKVFQTFESLFRPEERCSDKITLSSKVFVVLHILKHRTKSTLLTAIGEHVAFR